MADSQQTEPLFVAVSERLAALKQLSELVGGPVVNPQTLKDGAQVRAVLAWGCKPSANKAKVYAAQNGLPVWQLEDGFLRSVGLGNDAAPLSIVVDDTGIYYDATRPSALEALIAHPLATEQLRRAQTLAEQWRQGRVSKYNHSREMHGGLPERFVLVADQTYGDMSIRYGLADASNFTRMLEAALDEHPDKTVLLKVHPDVFDGRKRGHFERLTPGQAARVQVLGKDVHPAGLLERAAAVYAVTSQMGFEGLLWGKPVHSFGMPFYAGWGLTCDALPPPERRQPVALENLIHAALIAYPRYVDAETGKRCNAEQVLHYLALQRRMRERFPEQLYLSGFARWKKPVARAYFAGSQVKFVKYSWQIPAGATLAVWGRKPLPKRLPSNIEQLRVEDGFLRSVGLGADLVWPLSWVTDRRGIYYDATGPSELEELLQNTRFDTELTTRAKHLREAIVSHGLTKYNVGDGAWRRPDGILKVILVPGQIETDASIRYGSPHIRSNLELLQKVRAANPEAYIIYKLHPENRSDEEKRSAANCCNEVLHEMPITALYDSIDEVHVLTSQTGFEALLRGLPVVTYGQPFYAGWGLTDDKFPPARRTRQLSLDELVAGVLILYPTYVSRRTRHFTTPERALKELLEWRKEGATPPPLWMRAKRWFLKYINAVKT